MVLSSSKLPVITLKQHKMAKHVIKKNAMKMCSIMNNFRAGQGFIMKTDNTDSNKILPSFFVMFLGVFFQTPQK